VYNLGEYAAMMGDRARMRGFTRALEQAVKPGAVVVDLGAGTGIFSLLACRMGASRVHAIESSDAINVARAVIDANGFADRVEFHQAMSTHVTLPCRADVIFADLAGMLPWYELSISSIVDARNRFLKPGGVIIPATDAVWAAVVDAPDLYDAHTQPWARLELGFDLGSMHRLLTNVWARARIRPEDLLTTPARFLTIDYTAIEDATVRAHITWSAERSGTAHFIALGMDRMAGSPDWFSNDPTAPVDRQFTLVCAPMLLPLTTPVPLSHGDVVVVDLWANLAGDEYIWSWRTSIRDPRGDQIAAFAQSTFLAVPMSLADVKNSANTTRHGTE
jgi:protein arginine N-methyltransferase 1